MTAMQMAKEDMAGNAVTKIKRYGWTILDRPGVLMEIDKTELHVDPTYQRDVSSKDSKVIAIAGAWSWIACGAIIVAMRGGKAHVIDGQHRVLAAMKRADIVTLPCIVFETESTVQEAQGFLQANTFRKAMRASDQFRAMVVAGHPIAHKVDELVIRHGREVRTNASPETLSCIAALMRCAETDWGVLERIYPIISDLCEGRSITHKIVEGLFYIERFETKGKSLTEKRWRERLRKVGAEALETGARKMAGYSGMGGGKIWARGMVDVINRGLRDDLLEIPQ